MHNHKTFEKPQWLNDTKERDSRFGQLGLVANCDYSSLSKEEKQYLNEDRNARFIDKSYSIYKDNHENNENVSNKRSYVINFIKKLTTYRIHLSRQTKRTQTSLI